MAQNIDEPLELAEYPNDGGPCTTALCSGVFGRWCGSSCLSLVEKRPTGLPLSLIPINDELEGLHAEAARLAAIMWLVGGVAVAAAAVAGESQTRPPRSLGRAGSVGLVGSGEPPRWALHEHVPYVELGSGQTCRSLA